VGGIRAVAVRDRRRIASQRISILVAAGLCVLRRFDLLGDDHAASFCGRADCFGGIADDAAGGGDSLGDNDAQPTLMIDFNKFRLEVSETLRRGVAERLPLSIITLEINALKFAFDASFLDCTRAIVPVILEVSNEARISSTLLLSSLNTNILQFGSLLLRYMSNDFEFIPILQEVCENDSVLKNVFSRILYLFYKHDIITELEVLRWAEDNNSNMEFVLLANSFIEWLKTATTEEDHDQDHGNDD